MLSGGSPTQLCIRGPLQDKWREVRLLAWLEGVLESAEGGFGFFFVV